MAAPYNNIYNFFQQKNLKFNEVRRVLDNIYNCNQQLGKNVLSDFKRSNVYKFLIIRSLLTVINNILDNHNKLINLK